MIDPIIIFSHIGPAPKKTMNAKNKIAVIQWSLPIDLIVLSNFTPPVSLRMPLDYADF